MTTTNTYGRQVVIPLTNKSGGGVIAGDVVVVDTTNNDAFTTSTAGAFTGGVGIAQETIASNATGRVLISGYAALVNVNASVTRGNYGKTYTVARQATDAGSSRVTGTFCQFLTGGTTPDALVYPVDLAGAALTNPMTTKGDIITGDTGGTPTRLAAGATSGMVLTSAGSAAFPTMTLPPGYEYAYAQGTSNVNVTATTEGTANTLVTAGSVAFDGSTVVLIEFYSVSVNPSPTAGRDLSIFLYDDTGGGAASIGYIGYMVTPASANMNAPVRVARRLTPSNATHTYSVRAAVSAGTGIVAGGAGGAAANAPMFIRITKV